MSATCSTLSVLPSLRRVSFFLTAGLLANMSCIGLLGVKVQQNNYFTNRDRAMVSRTARVKWITHKSGGRESVLIDLRSIRAKRPGDHTPTPADVAFRSILQPIISESLPAWITTSSLDDFRSRYIDAYGMLRFESVGVPLPCTVRALGWRQYRGTAEVVDGIALFPTTSNIEYVLPVHIRAWPFAANTIIWSLCLALVLRACRVIRYKYRHRKRLCPECSYPLPSGQCPECGLQSTNASSDAP